MQNNTENVCRCCLKLVQSTNNIAFINVVTREMLSLLLIKLDLDVTEHPLVCGTCSEVLHEIYLFKSKCLDTEDIISAHVEIDSKFGLRDILIEMENKRNIHLEEDEVVCRLCIKIPLNGSYIALGGTGDGISLVRDLIQIHLPEMGLSIIKNPIICEVCHVQLKNYASFATVCMAVEEKIKLYCDIQKISGLVDLAHVLQFMEDKALNLQNSLNKNLFIKQEDDSVMVKVEKVQDADDLILENRIVDSSSALEFFLKTEEIEIKSENDEMREEISDSVPLGLCSNSVQSGSLKRKRQTRKSALKGRKHFSSDDHIARREGLTKVFGCQECTFKTNRKHFLVRHMVRHKDKTDVHKCVQSSYKNRNEKGMLNDQLSQNCNKRKCDKCPCKTDIKSNIWTHSLTDKDKSVVKMHKCENCEYETRHERNIRDHMVRHRDPRAERKFKCDKCSYETDCKYTLRSHNVIHKDKSEVKMHKCEICEYETRHKRSMKNHIVKHRDPKAERKFKCDKCSYGTDFNSDLRRHILIHMDKSEVQMHKCENCAYETRHKDTMKQHMVRHRDPEAKRKFKCDKCSYETDFKSYLGKHNLSHKDKSEVMMHKCEHCEYETKYKHCLNRHMAKHRDPQAERKFKCDKCPYGTDRKSHLNRHNLIHKDKAGEDVHVR